MWFINTHTNFCNSQDTYDPAAKSFLQVIISLNLFYHPVIELFFRRTSHTASSPQSNLRTLVNSQVSFLKCPGYWYLAFMGGTRTWGERGQLFFFFFKWWWKINFIRRITYILGPFKFLEPPTYKCGSAPACISKSTSYLWCMQYYISCYDHPGN